MSNSPILDELGNLEEKPWKINSPVDKGRIAAFVQAGYVLPEDFQAVLAITDGIACGLGEQEIYGIDLLIELAEVNRGTLREGVYAFGYFWGETLYIDSSRISTGDYIFYEGMGHDNGVLLGMDFGEFFCKLLSTNFYPFWQILPGKTEGLSYLFP